MFWLPQCAKKQIKKNRIVFGEDTGENDNDMFFTSPISVS